MSRAASFFRTATLTNLVKFPLFEATHVMMCCAPVPPVAGGLATGAIFCAMTLPITNYRFRRSMNMPTSASDLYAAFLPTVLRDGLYSVGRNHSSAQVATHAPAHAETDGGRFAGVFMTVASACLLSAPANELRGYCLQPAHRRRSPREFFELRMFARSTSVSTLIMALSLGIGALVTPRVELLWRSAREDVTDILSQGPADEFLPSAFH